MAKTLESPKRTLEERVGRICELSGKLPFPEQIALLRVLSPHIKGEKLISLVEPTVRELTVRAIEEENQIILPQIGSLAVDILSQSETTLQDRNELVSQVCTSLGKIAGETENWKLLNEARILYLQIEKEQEAQEITAQLEAIESAAEEKIDYREVAKRHLEQLLRQLFREGDGKTASEFIQEHSLQEEAKTILRNLEPAEATQKARLLNMPPELILELSDKALRCSDQQIVTLKEQIWLTALQIRVTEDEEKRQELQETLSAAQQTLVDAYLGRDNPRDAADFAEKIGDINRAIQIRRQALKEAINEERYDQAIRFAHQLGDHETEFKLLSKSGKFDQALSLAFDQKWADKLVKLIQEHLSEIQLYYGVLHDVLSFLQAEKETIEGASTAIQQAADHLKLYYVQTGCFTDAAEVCKVLELHQQVSIYEELELLIPKKGKKGRCYITTACCEAMRLDDNCEILNNLRWLRDHFIRTLPGGPTLIKRYYDTAPHILEKMTLQDLKELFRQAIKPASDLVKEGKHQEALELYKKTLQDLASKYLSPNGAPTIITA